MASKTIHLATTDYPIYCIKSLNSRYLIVAGGGGCSKTGVDNSMALYEIGYDSSHIYGKIVSLINMGLYAPMNIAYKTLNDKFCQYYLALGMGDMCQTFKLNKIVNKKLFEDIVSNPTLINTDAHETKVRHRTLSHDKSTIDLSEKHIMSNGIIHTNHSSLNSKTSSHNSFDNKKLSKTEEFLNQENEKLVALGKMNGYNHSHLVNKKLNEGQMELTDSSILNDTAFKYSSSKEISQNKNNKELEFISDFLLLPLDSVKTDTISVTGHQKAVRICSKRNLIVTGATDGHARLWKIDGMTKILDIKAHLNEVDDIEIHPFKPHIITASRDGHAYVWNLVNGSKICELEWNVGEHYRFRACRYGTLNPKGPIGDGESEGHVNLFTVHIPCRRSKVPQSCYLTKWLIKDQSYDMESVKVTGTEEPYILSLEHSGRYLAIGTSGGSVSVYKTTDLKRIAHFPKAHDIFVTGLDFVKFPTPQADSSIFPNRRRSTEASGTTLRDEESSGSAKENTTFLQSVTMRPPYFAGADTCLLSISVDRHIKLYRIFEPRHTLPYFLLATTFFLLSILLAYIMC